MPFSKFILIPIFVAFQAFTMMVITPYIPGNSAPLGAGLMNWVAFQAWAMYFMAGCTPKMAGKTLVGYIGGIIASIAIFELGLNGPLGSLNGEAGTWGLNIAVFIVVIFVISTERIPGLDFVPSYFIGAGVFFALMTYVAKPDATSTYAWYFQIAKPLLIACVIGLAYGWVTVTFRGWYEAKVAPKTAEAE